MAQHSPTLQFFCVLLGMVFHDLFNMYIWQTPIILRKTTGFLLDSPDFSNILVQSMIPPPLEKIHPVGPGHEGFWPYVG